MQPTPQKGFRRAITTALVVLVVAVVSVIAAVSGSTGTTQDQAQRDPSPLVDQGTGNSPPEALFGRILVLADTADSSTLARFLSPEVLPSTATVDAAPLLTDSSNAPDDTVAIVLDAKAIERVGPEWVRREYMAGRTIVGVGVELEDLASLVAPQIEKDDRDDGFSVTPGRRLTKAGVPFYSAVTGGPLSSCGQTTYAALADTDARRLVEDLRVHLGCVSSKLKGTEA